MRFLFLFLVLFGILKDTEAQIVFRPFKVQEFIQLDTSNRSLVHDSVGNYIDTLKQFENIDRTRPSNLLGGEILRSYFETIQGGNNLALQAVLINLDSSRILKDTLMEVIPVGMTYKGIYWGLGKHNFYMKDINVPFVVCILPQDSGKFETFRSEYSESADLKWVDVPQNKDSNQSVFRPISIEEYLLPLSCTHDPLFIDYINDSMVNMTIDFDTYNEISMARCYELLDAHVKHLLEIHAPYCERQAKVYFNNRNVNMESIRVFFEKFSELNVQLRLIFSETE